MRGAVLTLPLLLVGWWLSRQAPQPPSAFDDALDRALVPVLEQAEVQHKLGGVTSRHTRVLSRDLAERSVAYLGTRDLELWADTRTRAARASKATCAELWRGGDHRFLGPAVVRLGPEAVEAYAQMLARAFALRLERKVPPAVADRALERGLSAIADGLSPQERARFEADAGRPDVSDERACQLFLIVSEGSARLEPLLRAEFYRGLASQLQAPPSAP